MAKQRCECYKKPGSFLTFGPREWIQCENDAVMVVAFNEEDLNSTVVSRVVKACQSCYEEFQKREPNKHHEVKRFEPEGTVRITLYSHGSKESSYEAAKSAGLFDKALNNAMYLGLEHKMEYEVDRKTGKGELVAVDGIALATQL